MKRNNPFDSKLIQHTELIRDCRKQGISYVKIAKMLKKEHMLKVSPSTIYSFVKVRSKKRKVITMLEEELPPATIPKLVPSNTSVKSQRKKKVVTMIADDVPAITPPELSQEDLFGRPISAKKENVKTLNQEMNPGSKGEGEAGRMDTVGDLKRKLKQERIEEERRHMTPEELERAKRWDAVARAARNFKK